MQGEYMHKQLQVVCTADIKLWDEDCKGKYKTIRNVIDMQIQTAFMIYVTNTVHVYQKFVSIKNTKIDPFPQQNPKLLGLKIEKRSSW